MSNLGSGIPERTVVFACGDHRLRYQEARITEVYGSVARTFTPYGGMALYLLPDAPAAGGEYVLYQLDIARHFAIERVVEVFHGGAALCAAYGHLASKRGRASRGRADHDTLLALQREAAERAATILAERGFDYSAALYLVESLEGGCDRGRIVDLITMAPLGAPSTGGEPQEPKPRA